MNMLHMEIYSIEDRIAEARRMGSPAQSKNRPVVRNTRAYQNPAFRWRKKTFVSIVYLNLINRRRMLNLMLNA
jgi:hypothetical protein